MGIAGDVAGGVVKYGTAGAAGGWQPEGCRVPAAGAVGGAVKGLWDGLKNAPSTYNDSGNKLVAPVGPLEGGNIV